MVKIKFMRLDDSAVPFSYTRENDACMDIFSNEKCNIKPKETKIVSTGVLVELPHNFEGLVRGRSGLASKGIMVHLGTIDETYRGELGVIMTNLSSETFKITKGMRIAQFTVKPTFRIQLEEVPELSETERGDNGYGSSGL
jgi:dUTP pyrophosphatase